MAREAASDAQTTRAGDRLAPGTTVRALAVTGAAALLLAGCGGPARQDEDEPTGRYRVEVVEAAFPSDQKLAKSSRMTIAVRNVDTETIPNIAVTVGTEGARGTSSGDASAPGGFNFRDEGNEDPSKPIFVIDTTPRGGDTAYVNTWALGELKPGRTKTFNWDVTAVEARPYNIRYKVSAGLDGKAKAVSVTGESPPTGRFVGRVDGAPPQNKVADSGRKVIKADEAVGSRGGGN